MRSAGALAFVLQSMNPIGGVSASLPLGILVLKYSPILAWLSAVPLAYVQVVVVDLGWEMFLKWDFFRAQLERRRSGLAERLMSSPGAFWPTLVVSPIVGPWLVMALMRYARVPQRKVGPAIFLGLMWWSGALTLACVFAPRLVSRGP